MSGTLGAIHTNVGYLVFLILVIATIAAFRQSDARPPVSRSSSVAMILLDVHVTLGIVYYVAGGWWSATVLKSVAHPVLALLALAFGHIGLSKARKEGGSKRDAAYGLLRALILVTLAIGVVSA